MAAANEAGGHDNVTAVVVDIDSDDDGADETTLPREVLARDAGSARTRVTSRRSRAMRAATRSTPAPATSGAPAGLAWSTSAWRASGSPTPVRMTMPDVSYVPGALTAVAGGRCLALVEASPDSPAVARIWPQLGQGAAADAVLGRAARGRHRRRSRLRPARHGGRRDSTGCSAVARSAPPSYGAAAGRRSRTAAAGTAERIDGAGLLTWREQVVDADAERIFLGEPPADGALRLPAASGVLLAGCVVVDLTDFAARGTAREDEEARTARTRRRRPSRPTAAGRLRRGPAPASTRRRRAPCRQDTVDTSLTRRSPAAGRECSRPAPRRRPCPGHPERPPSTLPHDPRPRQHGRHGPAAIAALATPIPWGGDAQTVARPPRAAQAREMTTWSSPRRSPAGPGAAPSACGYRPGRHAPMPAACRAHLARRARQACRAAPGAPDRRPAVAGRARRADAACVMPAWAPQRRSRSRPAAQPPAAVAAEADGPASRAPRCSAPTLPGSSPRRRTASARWSPR